MTSRCGKWIGMLCLLGLPGCIPVNYHSEGWSRHRGSGTEIGDLLVSAHLSPTRSNAFNSNNDGPWRVQLGFHATKNHRVVVKSISLRDEQGKESRMAGNFSVPLNLVRERQWSGIYTCPEAVDLKFEENRRVDLEIDLSVDGNKSSKVRYTFTAKKVDGVEVINLGTM